MCDVPSDLAVTRANLGMRGQEVLGVLAEALRRGAEEELVMQREPRPVVLDAAFYDTSTSAEPAHARLPGQLPRHAVEAAGERGQRGRPREPHPEEILSLVTDTHSGRCLRILCCAPSPI